MGTLKTNIVLELINKVTRPAAAIRASLEKIGVSKTQIRSVDKALWMTEMRTRSFSRQLGKLAGVSALVGGAGLFFVKNQLIDTAAQFEKFRTVLETVEGSSAKAQASMDWVSDFAAKTPSEIDEVMESFVRLRAYGLDPTKGLLRSLGDTASSMGKPLMSAVEAIADAITGENERLKEFGITAETNGARVRYSFMDRAGKQQFKLVDKNNRAMIQSTLEAIWNEKYGGAMAKQSQTWNGMTSNIGDQWTRFKIKVMDAGLFDWLKKKLGGLLETIDRMAANGSLQKLAVVFGTKLKEGFIAAWNAAEAGWKVLTVLGRAVSWLANIMGGYENLATAVAVLMAGKLLLSVVSLAASFYTLGATAIPVAATAIRGLIPLIASTSVAAGGLLAILNNVALVGAAAVGGYAFGSLLNQGIGKLFDMGSGGKYKGEGAIGDWVYDLLHPEESAPATKQPSISRNFAPALPTLAPALPALASPVQSFRSSPAPPARANVDGQIDIRIISDAPTRVTRLESRNKDMILNVDTGLNTVGW